MPKSVNLVKAELQEIDLSNQGAEPSLKVPVQFNPETLKVTFSNQIQTPDSGSGDQRGGAAQQFVGTGTTKLALQLWFDVTVGLDKESVKDVRKLTEKIAYFITPKKDPKDEKKYLPPGVRFIWGSFQFDGIMESLEESLEFFSSEGIPLRSSMTINLTQQKIQYDFPKEMPKNTLGTKPLTLTRKGANLPEMASKAGKGNNWQAIAAANGIENPRQLRPGLLLDMNPKDGAAGGIGGSVPLSNETGAPVKFSGQDPFELE